MVRGLGTGITYVYSDRFFLSMEKWSLHSYLIIYIKSSMSYKLTKLLQKQYTSSRRGDEGAVPTFAVHEFNFHIEQVQL